MAQDHRVVQESMVDSNLGLSGINNSRALRVHVPSGNHPAVPSIQGEIFMRGPRDWLVRAYFGDPHREYYLLDS
jgi:hypothetical protein